MSQQFFKLKYLLHYLEMYKLPALWSKHLFVYIAFFIIIHIHIYILFVLRIFRYDL